MKTLTIDMTVNYELGLHLNFTTEEIEVLDDLITHTRINVNYTETEERNDNSVILDFGILDMNHEKHKIMINSLLELLRLIKEEFFFNELRLIGQYHHSVDEIMQLLNE